MNNKKVNWLFLCTILADYALQMIFIVMASLGILPNIGIVTNLIIAQLIIMIPALIFAMTSCVGEGAVRFSELLGFHKIKISTFFMVILFTFLIMPMTTAINAISMLFVDNEINALSDRILQMPFLVMLLMVGVVGPFSEEFIFRGIVFRGYKNSGSVLQAVIWSAILFGLMHMNFNQAAYAIAMGIMLALVVEATGSLWSSVIVHMVFNAQPVCMMYLVEYFKPGYYSGGSVDEALTNDELLAVIGPYLVLAVMATSLAVCLLVRIAKNENRAEHLRNIWACRKGNGKRIVSIPLIIAIILCIIFMCLNMIA